MFAAAPLSAPVLLPLLPPPIVGLLLPLPGGYRPTWVRPLSGGDLALLHLREPSAELPLPELLDAWQWAEVTINLLEPLEGIPLVLLAAQAGHVPAVVAEVDLGHLSRTQAAQWLREASTSKAPVLHLVLAEALQDGSGQAQVLSSRALPIASPALWRPLCRVLGEQLDLFDSGDENLVEMAADGVLAGPGMADSVLAGGPVATLVSSPAHQ